MDRLTELNEAKHATEQVIDRIDNAISSLEKAAAWGVWDLFGGGFFFSLAKRERIQEANRSIKDIPYALDKLDKELEDLNMELPAELSNTTDDYALDIWFDNIFTDIRVQGQIKEIIKELNNFRESIFDIYDQINEEIEKYKG